MEAILTISFLVGVSFALTLAPILYILYKALKKTSYWRLAIGTVALLFWVFVLISTQSFRPKNELFAKVGPVYIEEVPIFKPSTVKTLDEQWEEAKQKNKLEADQTKKEFSE